MKRTIFAVTALLALLPATAGAAVIGPEENVTMERVPKPKEAFPLSASDESASESLLVVSVSEWLPFQGDPIIVRCITYPAPDNIVIDWRGLLVPMKEERPGRYAGLIGVDLLDPPGPAPLSVNVTRGDASTRFDLPMAVRERAFPTQRLSLPRGMAVFDNATLSRIQEERQRLDDRFSRMSDPEWDLPFAAPVEAFRPTGFGVRRIINGEPRSPHTGVDIRLPEGTPVRSVAKGTVAFAGEQFFGGRSVVIDHGAGVFSIYYHLRDYDVAERQRVEKGERIGAVGATGRTTGPHLHFGLRTAGARVDPSSLIGDALPERTGAVDRAGDEEL
jgi:hypothetical protein